MRGGRPKEKKEVKRRLSETGLKNRYYEKRKIESFEARKQKKKTIKRKEERRGPEIK